MAIDGKYSGNISRIGVIGERPIMFLLELPDGRVPRGRDAATDFHDLIAKVREQNPGVRFQVIPALFGPLRGDNRGLIDIYIIAD